MKSLSVLTRHPRGDEDDIESRRRETDRLFNSHHPILSYYREPGDIEVFDKHCQRSCH